MDTEKKKLGCAHPVWMSCSCHNPKSSGVSQWPESVLVMSQNKPSPYELACLAYVTVIDVEHWYREVVISLNQNKLHSVGLATSIPKFGKARVPSFIWNDFLLGSLPIQHDGHLSLLERSCFVCF